MFLRRKPKSTATRKNRHQAVRRILVEPLESRRLMACDLYTGSVQELKSQLIALQSSIDSAINIGQHIPVIGDKLAEAGKVIDNFSGQLIDTLGTFDGDTTELAIRTALANVLHADPINLLADRNNDGLYNADDVDATLGTNENGSCTLEIGLGLSRTLAEIQLSTEAAFDLGLPALPFSVDSTGGVVVEVGFNWPDFRFTLDGDGGVEFDLTSTEDLTISVQAGLEPGTSLSAVMGFLQVEVTDGVIARDANGDPILDANGNQVVQKTKLEVGAGIDFSIDQDGSFLVDANVIAQADVMLHMAADIDVNFPSISTDFVMHWDGLSENSAPPTVAFKNISIDMGGALSEILGPLVDAVNKVAEPLKPIIDFVTEPIPVISDLAKEIGLGDVSILSLSELADDYIPPSGYKEIVEIVQLIVQILDIVYQFDSSGASLIFNAGDITLNGDGPTGNGDLRDKPDAAKLNKDNLKLTSLTDLKTASQVVRNVINAIEDSDLPQALKDNISDVLTQFTNGISYSFPILEDPLGQIGNLLVGKDASFFNFKLEAHLNSEAELTAPIGFGVDAIVGGIFELDTVIEVGYDSFGLRKFIVKGIENNGGFDGDDLLDGVYITRTSTIDMQGGFFVGAAFDAAVVQAQVSGGVYGSFHLGLPAEVDLVQSEFADGDETKIRPFSELEHCLFETEGSLKAGLNIKIRVGTDIIGFDIEETIAEFEIFSFDVDCVPNPFRQTDPQLASLDANGVLTLYVGTQAVNRTNYLPTDISEKYKLLAGYPLPDDTLPLPAGDIIDVYAFGMHQRFVGVKKIVAHAGPGNDSIQILASKNPLLYPLTADVELYGSEGNDVLEYEGTGTAKMWGGTGDDRLAGGAGNNWLFGEVGSDTLSGGASTNWLNGGDNDDNIAGGSGPNFLGSIVYEGVTLPENGNDHLAGGTGPNVIRGGAGNDTLLAGPVTDDLDGGQGDDTLVAGAGSARFRGNRGNDTILWEIGNGVPLLIDGGASAELNTLALGGTDLADTLTLTKDPSTPRVSIAGLTASAFLSSNIQNIVFEGLGGVDNITINPLSNTTVQQVGVNLSDVLKNKMGIGDGVADKIVFNGTAVDDSLLIEKEMAKIQLGVGKLPPVIGGIMKISGIPNYIVRLANVQDDLLVSSFAGKDFVTTSGITGPTRIRTGLGDDTIQVIAKSPGVAGNPNLLPDYATELNIEASQGVNQLIVDQNGSSIALNTLVTNQKISSELLPGVNFTAVNGSFGGGVKVISGNFDDVVNVRSTLANVPTSIDARAGTDVIRVGSAAPDDLGNLASILGPLSVEAGQGVNSLIVSDKSAVSGNANVFINADKILGFAGPLDNQTITFAATQGQLNVGLHGSDVASETFRLISPNSPVTVLGHGGNDSLRVTSLNHFAAFAGGIGNDNVEVGTGFNSLDNVLGSVVVVGNDGQDTLTVLDNASPQGHEYKLESNKFSRTNGTSIQFDPSLEQLNFAGTLQSDTLRVESMPPISTLVNVTGGTGAANKIIGPDISNIWLVNNANVGALNSNVNFTSFSELIGGTQADRFRMAPTGSIGKLQGGGGTDQLDFSLYTTAATINIAAQNATAVGAWSSIEAFRGGQVGDNLIGPNLPNGWQLTNLDIGTISTLALGNLSFTAIENLVGGTGTDNFQFTGNGALSGAISDLGGANDRLDYAPMTIPVNVNLNAGTASRVGSVSGIEHVNGGSSNDVIIGSAANNQLAGGDGNDILIGLGGEDQLFGNGGRDLLIGGLGSDSLDGGAGDDLLIGNRTSYDNNISALRTIMLEWSRNDLAYQARVQNLRLGGGLNGTINLNTNSVLSDDAVDTLFGGTNTDWYWVTPSGVNKDTLLDWTFGELVN